jgi:hypothetical protein
MRLQAIVSNERAKISAAGSYIAFLGSAKTELVSVHNYDEIRDARGNLHLRTKAQLHRDEESIHAYVPPPDIDEDAS